MKARKGGIQGEEVPGFDTWPGLIRELFKEFRLTLKKEKDCEQYDFVKKKKKSLLLLLLLLLLLSYVSKFAALIKDTAISRKVVGKKKNIKVYAKRPKDGLGNHWNFAYCPKGNLQVCFLHVENLFFLLGAYICSFTFTVACL